MIIIKFFNDYELIQRRITVFEELKTFITVVECKNFTRAGELLHLSQPSVSAHVKNLEHRFQTTLIHRSVKQKNIIITESGERFYQYAKEILQLTQEVSLDIHNTVPTVKGHLRVGASLTIGEYILPTFLATFLEKYPDIELEICMDNTCGIADQVKSLTLDIGLIEGSASSNHFIQEYVLEDHLVLALPYSPHLDGSPKNFSQIMDILKNSRWIIREGGSGTKEYLDLFLSSHEITPKQIMTMGSNYAIIESVRNGLGVTVISNLIAQLPANQKQISIYPLESYFRRHFSYLLPKAIPPSYAAECFIHELKKYTAHLSL